MPGIKRVGRQRRPSWSSVHPDEAYGLGVRLYRHTVDSSGTPVGIPFQSMAAPRLSLISSRQLTREPVWRRVNS